MSVKGFLLKNGTTAKYDYNELDNLPAIPQGEGLSDGAKRALLALLEKVAYTDANGEEYYDNLELALYPPANLVEITASFAQGVIVYDNQTLDSLKTSLTVTAAYDNGTTATIDGSHYTLSGTLATGQSTITVSYGGETATFTVNVTHATRQYTITNTLTNCTNSNPATLTNKNVEYSGTLTANSGYIVSTVSVTMDGTNITSTAYNEINKTITIATVTGDIVITAVAIEDVGWISGRAYEIDWGDGSQEINASGEVVASGNAREHASSLLPCHGASAIIPSIKPYDNYMYFYDQDGNFLVRTTTVLQLESPFPHPVPRNAYYARMFVRNSTPSDCVITPYLYQKLTESTVYVLNQHYVMDYPADTEDNYSTVSLKGLCYGARKFQTSMSSRSWIDFWDAEKQQISNVVRQTGREEIEIPEGTYYISLTPNGNINPWIKFTE